jgi:type III restriction enzyme
MITNDLLDLNDVANTDENFEIIMNLAEQLVEHLRSYLESPEDVLNVVMTQRKALVDFVHSQMQIHFDPPEYRFASVVERNFSFFRRTQIVLPANQDPIPFNQEPDALDRIAQIVFCGFKKSQYSLNKFQSNSERIFAVILEQDASVIKWVRPPRNSLQLFYHREKQYEPDFIVETDSHMFLCEIKSSAEIDDPVVVQKAKAAIHWCELATLHAGQNEGKPWTYLLIPHNAIRLSSSVNGLAKQFIQRTSQEM